MIRRSLLIAASAAMIVIPTAGPAYASPHDHATYTPAAESENPWLNQRVMNMAHSGGESEAPANSLYAFKRAVGLGSDMIELDIQSTADDDLVVFHDDEVDDATNGTGDITSLTTAEVTQLDAAYNFVPDVGTEPGLPEDSYPLRGVRTGDTAPPEGYAADDFGVPTLEQVLAEFPDTPINIEIKGSGFFDGDSFTHNARLLADVVNASGRTDLIVTSFKDSAISTFHELAPQIGLAPGMGGLAAYVLTGIKPIDGTVALQVPVTLYGTMPLATRDFVERAHNDGYAVHFWFSGTAPDDSATYNEVIDSCADGLMPSRPQLLEDILDERGIVRPGSGGTDPCNG